MIVTEIAPVTKQKYRILTEEQPAFVLYKSELSRYHLEEGSELSNETFEKILKDVLIKRAKLRAMHLLTRMNYTESELEKKLTQGEYTPMAVKEAMDYVRSFHYLDDQRYVEQYFLAHRQKKSLRQIEFDLMRKGISKEMIRACFEEQEEQDETRLIRELLMKRCKNPVQADEKEKNRQYGYLMRKGFKHSEIQQVFEEYFEKEL